MTQVPRPGPPSIRATTAKAWPVVRRVYNNNLVLAEEAGGGAVILVGKAIGYARKQDETVDPAMVECRFVPDTERRAERIAGRLADTPLEHVSLGRRIVELAHERLGLPVSQSLQLSVIDHLSSAIRRAKRGVVIGFPLRWEVTALYPAETKVGRESVAMADASTGIRLQKDEAISFALHFVNAQFATPDLSRTLWMTEVVGRIFTTLTQLWHSPLDDDSPSVSRFVTHLRHLLTRLESGRQLTGASEVLVSAVHAVVPAEAIRAETAVAALLEDALGRAVTREEHVYLLLHVDRLRRDLRAEHR